MEEHQVGLAVEECLRYQMTNFSSQFLNERRSAMKLKSVKWG